MQVVHRARSVHTAAQQEVPEEHSSESDMSVAASETHVAAKPAMHLPMAPSISASKSPAELFRQKAIASYGNETACLPCKRESGASSPLMHPRKRQKLNDSTAACSSPGKANSPVRCATGRDGDMLKKLWTQRPQETSFDLLMISDNTTNVLCNASARRALQRLFDKVAI